MFGPKWATECTNLPFFHQKDYPRLLIMQTNSWFSQTISPAVIFFEDVCLSDFTLGYFVTRWINIYIFNHTFQHYKFVTIHAWKYWFIYIAYKKNLLNFKLQFQIEVYTCIEREDEITPSPHTSPCEGEGSYCLLIPPHFVPSLSLYLGQVAPRPLTAHPSNKLWLSGMYSLNILTQYLMFYE